MRHHLPLRSPLRPLRALLAGLALCLALPTVASAAAPRERAQRGKVNARQDRQDARIDQGKASGEVTRGEARKLEHQQRHIDRVEHRAKADGNVSRAEAKKLDRMQDKANRDIHRAKHNERARPRAR